MRLQDVRWVTHEVSLPECDAAPFSIREADRENLCHSFGESPKDDLTGLSIWASAYVLAHWLVVEEGSLEGRAVMELGSGCGLAGIALAKNTAASEVVLTDFPTNTLENLRYNVALNARGGPGERGPAVRSLDWTDKSTWPGPGSIDLVIGSDLVYDDGMASLLAPLVAHVLRPGGNFIHIFPERGRVGVEEQTEALAATGLGLTFETDLPPGKLRTGHAIQPSGSEPPARHSMWHIFNECNSKRFIVRRYTKQPPPAAMGAREE